MPRKADLKVTLSAEDRRLRSDLRQAKRQWGRYSRAVSRDMQKVTRTVGLATAAITAGLTAATKASLDYADTTAKAARNAGLQAAEYQKLAYAFQIGGSSAEALTKSSQTLSKSVFDLSRGLSTQVDAFGKLGLAYDDLVNNSPAENLNLVLDRLRALEDPTIRSAVAQQLLGRAGKELGTIMETTTAQFRAQQARIESLGGVIGGPALSAAENLNDEISTLATVLKSQFADGLLSSVSSAQQFDETIRKAGEAANTIGAIIPKVTEVVFRHHKAILATAAAYAVLKVSIFSARLFTNMFNAAVAGVAIFRKLTLSTAALSLALKGGPVALAASLITIAGLFVLARINSDKFTASIRDAEKKAVSPLYGITAGPTASAKTIEKVKDTVEDIKNQAKDILNISDDLNQNITQSNKQLAVTVNVSGQLLGISERMAEGQQLLTDLNREYTQNAKDGLAEVRDSIREQENEWQRYYRQIREAEQAGIISREHANELFIQVQEKQREEYRKTLDQAKESSTKTSDEMVKIWEHATQRMQDAFADLIHGALWEKGIRSFRDFTDTLLNIWKRVVTEIVTAWATSGITGLLRGAGLLAGSSAATSAVASTVGSAASGTITGTANSIGSAIGGAVRSQIAKGFTFISSSIANFALGLPLTGVGGGLGNALLSGFGAGGSLLSLFNPATIGANAALAGGGIGATIGAALPAIGIGLAAAGVFDKISGGALFGGKPRLREQGIRFGLRGDASYTYFDQFANYKAKRGLFGGGGRSYSLAALPDDTTSALRQVAVETSESVKSLLDTFGLSSARLREFWFATNLDLKNLDEAARQAAISQTFQDFASGLLEFGLTANGLKIPVDAAAQSLNNLTEAAQVVQAAVQRAELIAAGRVDTLGLLQQSLVNATNQDLIKLLDAAEQEIISSGAETATVVAESIRAELQARAERAGQAEVVSRILDAAKVAIEGVNDLALLAVGATEQAFSFIRSAMSNAGDAVSQAMLGLADAISARAVQVVERLTSISATLSTGTDESRSLPSFNTGGIVPGPRGTPQLILAHAGETILPTHRRGGLSSGSGNVNVTVNVQGDADTATVRAIRNNLQEVALMIQDEVLAEGFQG